MLLRNETDYSNSEGINLRVDSKKPWLLVLLVDSSHSMGADWGGTRVPMLECVLESVNKTLHELAMDYCVNDGEVKNRVNLAVLVYGDEDHVSWGLKVKPDSNGYSKAGGQEGWVTGYRGVVESDEGDKTPVWLDLQPSGTTPMLLAIEGASEIVGAHCTEFPDSFPPTVINISDGEPTDAGEPADWEAMIRACEGITASSTNVGRALLCNVHLDPNPMGHGLPVLYPDNPGPAEHQRGLWAMSSEIPLDLAELMFVGEEGGVRSGRRFYVYNADAPAFQRFLEFGTRRNLGRANGNDASPPITTPSHSESSHISVEDAEFSVLEEE